MHRCEECAGYYPFGLAIKPLDKEGTPNHRFQFMGVEKEEALGLDWAMTEYRPYDGQLGRFFQVDQLAEHFLSWTPYHYSYNNPIAFSDPSGLAPSPFDEDNKRSNKFDDRSNGPIIKEGQSRYIAECQKCPKSSGYDKYRASNMPFSYEKGVGVYNDIGATVIGVEGGEIQTANTGLVAAATLTLATIETDVLIPEPSDLVPWKWVGYGIAGGAAATYLYFALTGDGDITVPIADVDVKRRKGGYVTIYKAPQAGMGAHLLANGFQEADFPRNLPYQDGNAYFAGPKSRALAAEYAAIYGEGVLEVSIPKPLYNRIFKPLERRYQGTNQKELPIPYELFPILNANPRTLTR